MYTATNLRSTRRTQIKKVYISIRHATSCRDTLLSIFFATTPSHCRPLSVAVVLPRVSGVVYLCRDTFFADFSAAIVCYHYIYIAYLLHDFD
jgi:hypothetical protein